MADPHKIHDAIRAKLVATSALTALIGQRVYNLYKPGLAATYPMISFGIVGGMMPAEHGLVTLECKFLIFTSGRDVIGAQQIAGALKDALHMGGLTATGWTVELVACQGGRMREIYEDEIVAWEEDYLIHAY